MNSIEQRINDLKSLIINADDLGRTRLINEGVEQAFRDGLVSSTSLPANAIEFKDALRIIHRNPHLGVGVHLHLNEYQALSDNLFIQQLSRLSMYQMYFKLFALRQKHRIFIRDEFKKQIEKLLQNNIYLTHLDGHNHCHIHPTLVEIIIKLCQEYSIRWIRVPREQIYNWSHIQRSLGQFVLSSVCLWSEKVIKNTINYPKHFYGISAHGKMNDAWLINIFKHIQPGINEIMCHVGLDNDDPPYSIGFGWKDELQVYTKYSKKDIFDRFQIRIISFKEAE